MKEVEKPLDLNQLRYFQKVARTQSVTRAAQELYVSQPTLSQSLSRLESSLGVPLFTHQAGKPLQLNAAGRAFLERVDAAFADLEEGVNIAREMNQKSVQASSPAPFMTCAMSWSLTISVCIRKCASLSGWWRSIPSQRCC